jgi:hypothetical protein
MTYIHLAGAAAEVGFSVSTLRALARSQRVVLWHIPGDRRTHIARVDLDRLRVPVARAARWTAGDEEE